MSDSPAIKTTTRGVSLALTITPRSGRDEVVGMAGDAIKIRLKAPPVDGRANEALLDFLAARLSVSHAALTILSGASGRRKVVQVAGISAEVATQRLLGTQ